MSAVTLHFSIEASTHFGSGSLWTKTIETPFLPREGDHVMLFNWRAGELNDGWTVPVQRPYWNTDGSVGVDLEHCVVDPSELMEQHVGRPAGHALHAWRSDQDGDLVALLVRSGWAPYGSTAGEA